MNFTMVLVVGHFLDLDDQKDHVFLLELSPRGEHYNLSC